MSIQGIIDKQKEKIRILQEEYDAALYHFAEGSLTFSDVHIKALRFFGYIEECCASNNSSAIMKDSGWNQWLGETCLDVLPLIVGHYDCYRKALGVPDFAPSERAYAGMQRLAKRLDKKAAIKIQEKFISLNMPVYGFNNKDKIKLNRSTDRYLGFAFGVIFICVILATAFTTPNPTSYQYTVFRIVLALAAGGVGAVLPGMLEVKFKNWLRASGAAAFFIIVYFYSPVALLANIEPSPQNSQSIITELK